MDYIVEVSSDIVLQHLNPNMALLKEIETRGIIVTAKSSSPKYDFVSRFFAPAAGIDEDPVTGSAHCCLAPYWAKKLNKNEFNAYQASSRGGELHVKLDGDRVYLSGKAVTILDGRLK
jgi:PhzF family phenazine biosynthesis protein